MNISRRNLLGAATLGTGALALNRAGFNIASAQNAAIPKLPIGMNLSGIADWEPGFPFLNLMWGARLWLTKNADGSGPWNTEKIEKIPLDENGYPLELPLKLDGIEQPQVAFTLLPNVRPPGQYVLLYEGDGEIAGVFTKIVDARPGRVVLQMKNDGNSPEGFTITRSRKGNHVRNIRVLPLEQEKADLSKNPFLPEFLEFCRPFHCLRFMDWMTTNASLEQAWNERKKPTFYSMVGAGGDADKFWGNGPNPTEYLFSGGVAIEICIDLCNRLQTDAWFCVPHRAAEEYMTEFAKLVRDRLDPKLKVYLEYSNEVWNWGFQQAQWMLRSKEAAAALEAKGIKAWEDAAKTKGANHPERTGALFRRCFAQWEKVFTGADRKRLVRVCAVQHSWLDTAQRTLKYVMENGGCDALSPAGYVGPSDTEYAAWEKAGAALTAEQVITDLNTAFDRDTVKWTREDAALAKQYNVDYIVYEGGQHLQPKGQAELPYNPALGAAQSHPKMYELYLRNLALHQEVGCKLFCAFASVGKQGTRYGSWGHLARYGQPLSEAPKMRALLDVNVPKRKLAPTETKAVNKPK